MQNKTEQSTAYLAEFLGTFALVFIGCSACIGHYLKPSQVSHLAVSLVFGVVVMLAVYMLGGISGAHINPAVTIGLALVRRFPASRVLPYVLVQCLGAICAGFGHLLVFGPEISSAAGFGATLPTGIGSGGAFIIEFLMTFFLISVILTMISDFSHSRTIQGVSIGAVIFVGSLATGTFCGASMNPARSLGPALFSGGAALNTLWLYICAPVLGAAAGAVVFVYMRSRKEKAAAVKP